MVFLSREALVVFYRAVFILALSLFIIYKSSLLGNIEKYLKAPQTIKESSLALSSPNVSEAPRETKVSSFALSLPNIANDDSINFLTQKRVAVVGFPRYEGIYQGMDMNSCSKLPLVHMKNYSVSVIPHSVWADGLNGGNFPCQCFQMLSLIFAPDLIRLPFSWSVPGWIESKGHWNLEDPKVDYPFEQEAVDILCTYDVIISTGPTHLPPCPKKMVHDGYEKKLVDNWQYRLYMPLEPDWGWLNFDLNKWGNWCSAVLWNYGHASFEGMMIQSNFSANLLPHLRKPKLSGIYFHYVYDLQTEIRSQNIDWKNHPPTYDHTSSKVLLLRRSFMGSDIKSQLKNDSIPYEEKVTWKNCSELHQYLAIVDVGDWLSSNQFAVNAALCRTISISTKYRLFQTLLHHPDLLADNDETAMVLIRKLKNNSTLRNFYIDFSYNNLKFVNLTQKQISFSSILRKARKACPLTIEYVQPSKLT